MRVSAIVVLLLLTLLAACGDDDDGTDGAVDHDAPSDGATDSTSDASIDGASDGAGVTCEGDDVIVYHCCGGAPPVCVDPLANGDCPEGSELGSCYGEGGIEYGCAVTCTPPAPTCTPSPPDCNEACGGGGLFEDGHCSCLCA